MPKESKRSKKARAAKICMRLEKRYGHLGAALNYSSPFTLVIAVLLSAQTTDKAVNSVTPELFKRWPDPQTLAAAPLAEVEEVIHSLGFYRTKARHVIECAQALVSDHQGVVPQTMEELTQLAGVGRKTANIVLNKAFGITQGIAVDTHVFRIATRLGFTAAKTPAAAEKDLLNTIDKQFWPKVNETWIYLGREICSARAAKCEICPLAELCPYPHSKQKAKRKAKPKS